MNMITSMGVTAPADQVDSTRRALIVGAAAIPLALAAPAAAQSSRFAGKVAVLRSEHKRAGDFDRNVWRPTWKRYDASCDAVPHHREEWRPRNGLLHSLSTASERDVKWARGYVVMGQGMRQDDLLAAATRIVAAADARLDSWERIGRETGFNAADARLTALDAAWTAALDDVITCPVASINELSEKIAIIDEFDQWGVQTEFVAPAISADVRRLAGVAV